MLVSILSEKEPPPLSSDTRDVPAEMERISGKALRKNRDERYQHIKDFALDLKDLKGELEFAARLERSVPPERNGKQPAANEAQEEKTVLLNRPSSTAKVSAAARATSVFSSIADVIKRHKRGAMIALASIILLSLAIIAYNLYFAPSGKMIDSIAVLPLANMTNDPNLEYLSDGISESLINSLTELQQLRVIARTTAFRYKGREVDPQTAGRELNVRAVLTGSVPRRCRY